MYSVCIPENISRWWKKPILEFLDQMTRLFQNTNHPLKKKTIQTLTLLNFLMKMRLRNARVWLAYGSMQWLITLGRLDLQTDVMTLSSSFRAKPRKRHSLRAKQIYSYIEKLKGFKIRFWVEEPDMSAFDNTTKMDWSRDVYEDFEEEIPQDAPTPYGKKVTLIHYFNANLIHDVLSY